MKKLVYFILSKFMNKDFVIDICFGLLLILLWNKIGSNIRIMVAALDGNMVKVLDANSPNLCERSVYAMVDCNKYGVYFLELSAVLAALLYVKCRKWAFLCLIFLPILSFCLFYMFL